jgi:hypothetical protein
MKTDQVVPSLSALKTVSNTNISAHFGRFYSLITEQKEQSLETLGEEPN